MTAAEQAAAKNRYAGRLTADFLEERLGHRLFDRIRDLDCSGLKIRDVGSVFLSEDMEGLQVGRECRKHGVTHAGATVVYWQVLPKTRRGGQTGAVRVFWRVWRFVEMLWFFVQGGHGMGVLQLGYGGELLVLAWRGYRRHGQGAGLGEGSNGCG